MRRTPLVIAGLAAGLAVSGCAGADDSPSSPEPAASSAASSTPPLEPTETGPDDGDGSVTELTVDPATGTGRCAVPTPAILRGNELAFDGVVEAVDDSGLVTLRPTAFYAGEPTDTVTVQAPGEDLQLLLSAVAFEDGGRYLVAADDGQVALCTISAPWSAQLATTYEQAFGAPR